MQKFLTEKIVLVPRENSLFRFALKTKVKNLRSFPLKQRKRALMWFIIGIIVIIFMYNFADSKRLKRMKGKGLAENHRLNVLSFCGRLCGDFRRILLMTWDDIQNSIIYVLNVKLGLFLLLLLILCDLFNIFDLKKAVNFISNRFFAIRYLTSQQNPPFFRSNKIFDPLSEKLNLSNKKSKLRGRTVKN